MLLISQKKNTFYEIVNENLAIFMTEGVHYDTQPIKERAFCNNNKLVRIGRKFEQLFFDGPIR